MIDRRTISLLLALLFAPGHAVAAELKVMATGSMAAPLRQIAQDFAKQTGHTVNVTVGITTTVSATLQAGDTADLIEVTSFGMEQLERDRFILEGSQVEIAQAVIGIAVVAGGAVPVVSREDALKRVLLSARVVAYVNPRVAGQVGVNMRTFLQRLGIADEITRKAVLTVTGEDAVQLVAKGEADVAIAFVSEIRPVKGVAWLGPIPETVQTPTAYSAAIGAHAQNPDLARALLSAIQSPAGRRRIAEAGLEPAREPAS